MEIKELKRVFKKGNLVLDDPNPNFTLTEVRKFYAGQYPDLINAQIEGPEIEDDKQVYSFTNSVGTKG